MKDKLRMYDLVITKMAEYICKQDIDEDICTPNDYEQEFGYGQCIDNEGNKIDCIECIIKHFTEVTNNE